MKHHHPDVFCAALLNAQPMGFYAPAQIVRDAREHGVEVRPVCINASRWDCTLEPTGGPLSRRPARASAGPRARQRRMAPRSSRARGEAPFESVEEVWRRAGVPRAAIERLAEADAFHALGEDRRQGLWKVRGLGEAPLPLFAAADEREAAVQPGRARARRRAAAADRRARGGRGLSLAAAVAARASADLPARRAGAARHRPLRRSRERSRDGRHVEVAGVILVRQKPGSAKGVLFITIEDETGIANGILWPDRFEAQRRTVMSASMVGMKGRVQKEGEVIHVICDRIIDHGDLLRQVGEMSFPHRTGRGDGAPHAGSPDRGDKGWSPDPRDSYWPPHAAAVDPEDVVRFKSRDFH